MAETENELLKEVQTLRWALTLLTVVTLGTLLYAISAISQQTVAVLDQVTELKVMAEAINGKLRSGSVVENPGPPAIAKKK